MSETAQTTIRVFMEGGGEHANHDSADSWSIDGRGGLDVYRGSSIVASWAAGTWQRVELLEEVAGK